MYILLLWVVLISIHITSLSWSSMFSTCVVLLLISSLVVIATPPPSFPGLCLCVQLAYPWILGGAVFVSFMQIMSAPYSSAADCRLASFPFIPFTFAYIIFISFFLFLIFCLFFPWAFFLSFCLFSIMRVVTVSLIRTHFFCFGFLWLGSGSVVISWLMGFFVGFLGYVSYLLCCL